MTLEVQVVSPEKRVWSGQASMVVARTLDGEIGVLTGHAPTLAILADGDVRVVGEGSEGLTTAVSGGFISVEHDTVLVVAEHVGEREASREGTADERSRAAH